MKLYNTLTKKIEEFRPLENNEVKMYVCGITPYDYTHLGHARSYVFFDSLRRYLEFKGYRVKYVQNFTDIDDKIIKKSNEEKKSWREISEKYIKEYLKDIRKLGVKEPDVSPKATEVIDEIVDAVKILIEKGFAYEISDGIYYDVSKFKNYGKLSGKRLDELIEGARIEVNPEKRNSFDFALWKFKKAGEPFWETDIGKGRPGWHIECSVMSMKYLGKTIDIHGGGQDLIFPHHENEIAQSEAITGKKFSNFFIHNGFLTINKEKMSKSLKNFFLLKDLYKEFSPEAIRFFLLKEHWKSPLDFTLEKLKEAEKTVYDINNLLDEVKSILKDKEVKVDKYEIDEVEKIREEFFNSLEENFNTPKAIGEVFKLLNFMNKNLYSSMKAILEGYSLFNEFDEILQIFSLERKKVEFPIKKEEIEKLIKERDEARKNKNFEKADKIREYLKNKGILLEDTPRGTKYKIILD